MKYSTRLLLWLVTLTAIALAYARWTINGYERVARDVETLHQIGFVVDLESQSDRFLARFASDFAGSPTYIRLYSNALSTEETDELLEIIGRNPSIQKMMIDVEISDDDAARLLVLPLDSLGISESSVGDTLDASASPTLEWLSFHRTRLNDNSLKSLGPLPVLKYLDLTRTRVSDRSIEYLATLPRLEDVILRRCKVTSEGAEMLRELRPDVTVHWERLSR